MRVIAGSARGVKLIAPDGRLTRPTADRVKEALFSIISSRWSIQTARVLDLCAGTGGLGIEALSRGASSCCFVEHDRKVMAVLQRNLVSARLNEYGVCLVADAVAALQGLARRGSVFSMVFFDPPYESGLYAPVLDALDSLTLLSQDAVVVAECAARTHLEGQFGSLEKIDRRVYGDCALEFFVREHP